MPPFQRDDNMNVYIDADACPVIDAAIKICKNHNLKCTLVADCTHSIVKDGADTITVSKGADSADFKIVNLISKTDIVVTQDYGLAAMCMAKGAFCINQDGLLYTTDNIDGLLFFRNEARRLRACGKRSPHIKKRSKSQNTQFEISFEELIKKAEEVI